MTEGYGKIAQDAECVFYETKPRYTRAMKKVLIGTV